MVLSDYLTDSIDSLGDYAKKTFIQPEASKIRPTLGQQLSVTASQPLNNLKSNLTNTWGDAKSFGNTVGGTFSDYGAKQNGIVPSLNGGLKLAGDINDLKSNPFQGQIPTLPTLSGGQLGAPNENGHREITPEGKAYLNSFGGDNSYLLQQPTTDTGMSQPSMQKATKGKSGAAGVGIQIGKQVGEALAQTAAPAATTSSASLLTSLLALL